MILPLRFVVKVTKLGSDSLKRLSWPLSNTVSTIESINWKNSTRILDDVSFAYFQNLASLKSLSNLSKLFTASLGLALSADLLRYFESEANMYLRKSDVAFKLMQTTVSYFCNASSSVVHLQIRTTFVQDKKSTSKGVKRNLLQIRQAFMGLNDQIIVENV